MGLEGRNLPPLVGVGLEERPREEGKLTGVDVKEERAREKRAAVSVRKLSEQMTRIITPTARTGILTGGTHKKIGEITGGKSPCSSSSSSSQIPN